MAGYITEFERAMVRTTLIDLWQSQHMAWRAKWEALAFAAYMVIHLQGLDPYLEELAEDLTFLGALARTHATTSRGYSHD